jgi:hypothetical protein
VSPALHRNLNVSPPGKSEIGQGKGTVPSGLLSQIEGAKCAAGKLLGVIPFD